MFKNLLIYYFSATGNTLRIAKAIAEEVQSFGANVELWKIENGVSGSHNEFSAFGFAYPVHFWGMPLCFEEFLKYTGKTDGKPAFVAATMAGWRMKFKLGESFVLLSAKRTIEKIGFKFIGGQCFLMPENFSVMYNPPDKAQAGLIIEKSVKQARQFARMLIEGNIKTRLTFYPDHLVWSSINLLPKIFKRYGVLSLFFRVNERCNSCGICVRCCPTQNIKLFESKPKWGKKCVLCFRCINLCPVKAIEYTFLTKKRRQYIEPSTKIEELLL